MITGHQISGAYRETLRLATRQAVIDWPVHGEIEKSVLLQGAARHGLSLDGRTPGASPAGPMRGVVAALGSAAKDAAQLYASLTLRDHRPVDHSFDLLGVEDLAVVVTTPDHLSPDLFDILQWARPGSAPGLIFADEEHLRLRCMVCALAAHGPMQATSYAEYFSRGVHPFAPDANGRADGPAETADLRRLISEAMGLLVMQIHCDGIDAYLSRDTILCARLEESGPLESHLCGRCYQEDWCHRLSLALSDGALNQLLLSPRMIRAGILLFDVCWGLLPPANVVHPRHGLGFALTRNLNISAIISTWRPVFHSSDSIRGLVTDLRAGVPLGEAVGRHNASPEAQNLDLAFCIFGDPAARCSPQAPDAGTDSRATAVRPAVSVVPTAERTAQATALLAIRHLCRSPMMKHSAASELLVATERLQGLIDSDLAPPEARHGARDIRNGVMKLLCEEGPKLDIHWMYDAKATYMDTTNHACLCGDPPCERLVTFRVRLGGDDRLCRILGLCQRCGIAEDLDPSLSVRVSAAGGSLRITGLSPQSDAQAALVVKGQQNTDRHVIPWPREQGEQLADTFELPRLRSAGVVQVAAVVMEDLRFSVFSYMIPARQIAAAAASRADG